MPTDTAATAGLSAARRWSIVVISLLVTASAFVFINGVAFLIPALEDDLGTPLAEAGLLSSMPSFGMVATLILWGYLLDRVGERVVLTVGSGLTAAAAYGATTGHSVVAFAAWLFVGGMAAASCNSAGGRLVSGWFPPEQRGLAMGVRQTAQPLGIALGALVIPILAERSRSAMSALIFPAVLCAAAAVLSVVAIIDPPRKERAEATEQELANPYRGSWVLRRIHAVSALLMVPQTRDRDVHADLADRELSVLDPHGGLPCHGVAVARRGGPRPGRPVVGPGRLPAASGPHHRRRRCRGSAPAWRLPIICARSSRCR